MPKTTISSREYNQNKAEAYKAVKKGPVYITNRNQPSLVLTTQADYERERGKSMNLAESLAMPGGEDIDFDPPRMGQISRPVEFD
jgi:PHD/YefM family antitoxin component YafN of YafNO toxin-antitoxin module